MKGNEKKVGKKYFFIYTTNRGGFNYRATFLDETPTHYIICDEKEGRIELPKISTVVKELKEVDENVDWSYGYEKKGCWKDNW